MRRCALALLVLACVAERPVPVRAGLGGLGSLPIEAVDPLLAAARTAIEGGTLDPEVRAALLASTNPAHARAQRILLAMEQERLVAPPPTPAPTTKAAPTLRVATAPPEPVPRKAAQVRGGGAVPASTATRLPPPKPQAVLRSVGLQRSKAGAMLTLTGSGGLVVGVANQPVSGIVRFVMDATADTRALQARPRVAGRAGHRSAAHGQVRLRDAFARARVAPGSDPSHRQRREGRPASTELNRVL